MGMFSMAGRKVRQGLAEIPTEIDRIVSGRYPGFVTGDGKDPLRDEVPVFMFHSVERETFEEQLFHLKRNGYRTLTIRGFMSFLKGALRLKEPSVLLTFDDGEKSLYDVAYPLLSRYGFHAVAFAVPHFLGGEEESGASPGFASWSQLLEMDRSGVVDIQSHSYYHDRIFVDPVLVDFYHPGYGPDPLGLSLPWTGDGEHYSNRLEYGTPLYRHAPRLSGRPRYVEDACVRRSCVEWAASRGKEFFSGPLWRRHLIRHYRSVRKNGGTPAFESEIEQRIRIFDNLQRSRNILQDRLDKPVEHLCYPWGEGSPLALELSRGAGYISNFWVAPGDRNTNRKGDSPFRIPRVKDDYILRLPGKGRESLARIAGMKLKRRIGRAYIY